MGCRPEAGLRDVSTRTLLPMHGWSPNNGNNAIADASSYLRSIECEQRVEARLLTYSCCGIVHVDFSLESSLSRPRLGMIKPGPPQKKRDCGLHPRIWIAHQAQRHYRKLYSILHPSLAVHSHTPSSIARSLCWSTARIILS